MYALVKPFFPSLYGKNELIIWVFFFKYFVKLPSQLI